MSTTINLKNEAQGLQALRDSGRISPHWTSQGGTLSKVTYGRDTIPDDGTLYLVMRAKKHDKHAVWLLCGTSEYPNIILACGVVQQEQGACAEAQRQADQALANLDSENPATYICTPSAEDRHSFWQFDLVGLEEGDGVFSGDIQAGEGSSSAPQA